jgi:hypothetical protein
MQSAPTNSSSECDTREVQYFETCANWQFEFTVEQTVSLELQICKILLQQFNGRMNWTYDE